MAFVNYFAPLSSCLNGYYNCNDRTFYMVVLVGYSNAGRRIVVVAQSERISLSGQPRVVASSRHDSGAAKR